jgi:hypothetical protein
MSPNNSDTLILANVPNILTSMFGMSDEVLPLAFSAAFLSALLCGSDLFWLLN